MPTSAGNFFSQLFSGILLGKLKAIGSFFKRVFTGKKSLSLDQRIEALRRAGFSEELIKEVRALGEMFENVNVPKFEKMILEKLRKLKKK